MTVEMRRSMMVQDAVARKMSTMIVMDMELIPKVLRLESQTVDQCHPRSMMIREYEDCLMKMRQRLRRHSKRHQTQQALPKIAILVRMDREYALTCTETR